MQSDNGIILWGDTEVLRIDEGYGVFPVFYGKYEILTTDKDLLYVLSCGHDVGKHKEIAGKCGRHVLQDWHMRLTDGARYSISIPALNSSTHTASWRLRQGPAGGPNP